VLTAEDHERLAATGFARLPGAVDRATADAMAEQVWASLAARGIERADPRTWPAGFVGKHQSLRRRRVFDAFATPAVAALADAVLGSGGWQEVGGWGPALVTFPEPGPWIVPHDVWHVDIPAKGDPNRPAVARLFAYVNDVVPQGGGRVVVEGSHELVRRLVAAAPDHDAGSSSRVRRRLMARSPWFQALDREGGGDRVRQFMVDGDEVDGVRVRVAELTGEAGDVVVMLPWTLHCLAMNCSPAPRFMVTHSLFAAPARLDPST
jgi:Phytanoyl-CoA dioxygenase (PhyH)